MIYIRGTLFLGKNPRGESVYKTELKNGATRRTLVVTMPAGDKTELQVKDPIIEGTVSLLDKGNHSFFFINPSSQPCEDRGVFICSDYGVTVRTPNGELAGEDTFRYRSSRGGYGNSESVVVVAIKECYIYEHSYKHRRGDTIWHYQPSKGWECLGKDAPICNVDGVGEPI